MSMKMTMAEFVGLELCPFCKGEAFYNPGYNGGNVECRECGAEGPYKRTEAEAIAAWNSRADYHGYEQAAIEAWESIKAWNTRAERTCHWELEHSGTLYDKWCCSKCGYLFVEPRCDQGYTDLEPNYCPNCGARVVE